MTTLLTKLAERIR